MGCQDTVPTFCTTAMASGYCGHATILAPKNGTTVFVFFFGCLTNPPVPADSVAAVSREAEVTPPGGTVCDAQPSHRGVYTFCSAGGPGAGCARHTPWAFGGGGA